MDTQSKLEIHGSIRKHTCAELFAEISQAGLTGSFRVSKGKQKVIVYFDDGKVVFAVSNSRDHRLFEIILEENIVPRKEVLSIDGFVNDLHLAKVLESQQNLEKPAVDSLFSVQIQRILGAVLGWDDGSWSFSPLAKLKDGIRFETNINRILRKYAAGISDKHVVGRFRSISEGFSLISPELNFEDAENSREAFILSRFGDATLSIDEIRSFTGLPSDEVIGILYRLWLGGILRRENWNPHIKEKDVLKINEAKLTLKTSASEYVNAQEIEKQKREAEKAKELFEKEQADLAAKQKASTIKKISLEAYLKQVKEAATHYEVFGVSPDAKISEVKKVYFHFAKNFHPDLYHRNVQQEKHREIQVAFTEIARAYDTLRDPKSREVYDFKLRKVIEAARTGVRPAKFKDGDDTAFRDSETAAAEFERGYGFFMDGFFDKSLPYLERATRLDSDNGRYHAYFGKALSHDSGKRHQAESELQTAVRLDSDNPKYHMMLAELYYDIGLTARARGELNRVLELIPEDNEALSLLDRLG